MFKKIKSYFKIIIQNSTKLYLFIFIISFLVRFCYILTLENKWYFYDTVHYDKAAQSILTGEGFGRGYYFSSIEEFQDEYSLPPVYPVFLAGIYKLFGQDFLVVRIVQSVIGALLSIMIFLIGKKVFHEKVGLLASLISIFYPLLIFTCGLLYVTVLFTFFIALFVWFLLNISERENIWLLILAGLCLGIATLAGPILFAVYPLVGLWIFLVLKRPLISKFKYATIVFAVATMTLIPWGIRNYKIFGKITPVSASVDWFLSEAQSRIQNQLSVQIHSDNVGHHFDVFVNNDYDGTLTDTARVQGKSPQLYYGIILKGGLSKYIERFEIHKDQDVIQNTSELKDSRIVVDEFEQNKLDNDWEADSVFKVMNGQLVNSSKNIEKDFLAVYKSVFSPSEVMIKWGKDTEAAGVSQTGLALMLDKCSLDANGYLVKRQPYGLLELWLIEGGTPTKLITKKMGQKSLVIASNGENNQDHIISRGGIIGKTVYILTDDPKGFFKHYISEFIHFWQLYPDRVMTKNEFTDWKTIIVSIVTFSPILALCILGLIFSFSNWRKVSLLFLTIISFALGYSFFQTRVRYRIPIEPYMIIFAAYGFLILAKKLINLVKAK